MTRFFGSGSGGDSFLELRPMSVLELIDGALEICSRHGAALLVVVLPAYLLLGAALLVVVSFAEFPPPEYGGGFGFYFLAGGVISALLFLTNLGHGAGVYYLYRAEAGVPVSPAEALAKALRHAGSLVLVAAVTFAAAGMAALVFVIPGIAVYSLFAVCTPVVMVEDVGYMRGLKRGYRILRDFFGRAFKAHVVLCLLWIAVFFTLHATAHISLLIARSFFDMEVGLASNALSLLNLTYVAFLNVVVMFGAAGPLCALAVLIYVDARVRTEGIDIERRIEALPAVEGGRT